MNTLFGDLDFSRLKKNDADVRKLTVDEVGSGGYDGWLRVEIIGAHKGYSKKDSNYLSVTYESVYDSDPWCLTHCYFSIDDLRDLCQAIGITSLKEGDLPGAVVGKRLEISCRVKGKFVSVRSHQASSVQAVAQ